VTGDVTGTNEVAEGTVTAVVDNLETSTIVLVDNGTNVFTSVKPGNGHGAEDNDTTIAAEGTTSADSASEEPTTVDAVTIDSNATTIADNETSTVVPSNVTGTEQDTLLTTTIGIDYIIRIANEMVCARQSQ
jgi:hypothetical protein